MKKFLFLVYAFAITGCQSPVILGTDDGFQGTIIEELKEIIFDGFKALYHVSEFAVLQDDGSLGADKLNLPGTAGKEKIALIGIGSWTLGEIITFERLQNGDDLFLDLCGEVGAPIESDSPNNKCISLEEGSAQGYLLVQGEAVWSVSFKAGSGTLSGAALGVWTSIIFFVTNGPEDKANENDVDENEGNGFFPKK